MPRFKHHWHVEEAPSGGPPDNRSDGFANREEAKALAVVRAWVYSNRGHEVRGSASRGYKIGALRDHPERTIHVVRCEEPRCKRALGALGGMEP